MRLSVRYAHDEILLGQHISTHCEIGMSADCANTQEYP